MFNDMNEISISIYSVSDLNAYIRALLEGNGNLMDIWVSGEVSNLSQPRSGHIYFTLKDENAQVRCVVWRVHAVRLAGVLRDGMLIEAHGAVGVYEGGGQYQLYVDGMRTAGEGQLYQEFLRLKDTLTNEGLFDEERKRPITQIPKVIGIVTSATGAALHDMLNTLRGRYPLAEVILSPATVQGDAAPEQIVDAIMRLNKYVKPDVIIVGRGGGSLEDLWAFNDERVVRAVAASQSPVISGVGHETDFTLTDFAADLRAPTPTGAAVAAVPDMMDLVDDLRSRQILIRQLMRARLDDLKTAMLETTMSLERISPEGKIQQHMQKLDNFSMRLNHIQEKFFSYHRKALDVAFEKLSGFDPRNILQRGYSIVEDEKGNLVTSTKQVQLGVGIRAWIADGVISADVTGIEKKKVRKNGKKN